MTDIALYRKYRPQNFTNLVGQDHVRTTILNALKEEHIAHAYLFCGPRGTGKTTTARLIAKAVNCANPNAENEPCDECDICVDTTDGRLIDLIEIDAASNRGIDEMRDLKEKINFAPSRAKHKVYIIDEVHMLTKEAFNALLKTLEEPPSHTFFILCTTEAHKVPETIISRCQRFDFKRVDIKAMMTRLNFIAQSEGIEAEERAIEAICRHVDGGLRDAIGLLDQLTVSGKLTFDNVQNVLGIADMGTIEGLYSALFNKDASGGLQIIQSLHGQGIDLTQFTREFLDYLRVMMLDNVKSGDKALVSLILEFIDGFQIAASGLKNSAIPQLPLEIAVVKICNGQVQPVLEAYVATPSQPKIEMPKVEPPREHQKLEKPEVKTEGKIPLTISYLKENWPRIMEHITLPAVRRSLSESKPIKVEGPDVLLEFTTKFHLEKVLGNEGRVPVEKAFFAVFGEKVKIMGNLKEVELNANSGDLVSDALEIFGGELVED